MKYFNIYITFAFIVKLIFIVLALTYIFIKTKGKENSSLAIKIKYWKERVEFIFTILMAILLIYLFSPRANRTIMINHEAKLLLYLFGFVLLITAKWGEFIKESKWFIYLQNSLENKSK
jgi:hypothetical protein